MENKDRAEIFRAMLKTSRHRYRLQKTFQHEPSHRLYPQGNRAVAEIVVSESGGSDGLITLRYRLELILPLLPIANTIRNMQLKNTPQRKSLISQQNTDTALA